MSKLKPTRKVNNDHGKSAKSAPQERMDGGWINPYTGIGTTLDKSQATKFGDPVRLTRQQVSALWEGDDIAAKIIEDLPNEAMREGFTLTIKDEEAPTTEGAIDPKTGEPVPVEGELDPLTGEPINEDPEDVTGEAPVPGTEGEPALEAKPGEEPAPKPEDEQAPAFAKKKPAARKDFGFGAPPAAAPPKPPAPIEPRGMQSRAQADEIMAKYDDLKANERIKRALEYQRAYGGAAVLLGVDDGTTDWELPMNEEGIKDLLFLTTFMKEELVPVAWYSDPFKPKFGEVEIYSIQPTSVPISSSGSAAKQEQETTHTLRRIHETRLCVLIGNTTGSDSAQVNNGMGFSALNRCYNVLANFEGTWAAIGAIMQEYGIPYFKVPELNKALAQGKGDVLKNRITALMLGRSAVRGYVLDALEEFGREVPTLTGVSELLDQFAIRMAAAANMPVTRLFGTSAKGLNATGEGDERGYANTAASYQKNTAKPVISKILSCIMRSSAGPCAGKEPENWDVEFIPLYQLSEQEQVDMRSTQAATDEKYVNMGVVTPEEIAASRFGGGKYSIETVIDFEGRKQLAVKHEQDMAVKQQQDAELAKKGVVPGAPPAVDEKGKPVPPGKPGAAPAPFPPKAAGEEPKPAEEELVKP